MSWVDTVFKFLGQARYTALAPSLTDGQTGEMRCDQNGRLLVNSDSPTTLWSDGGNSSPSRQVKTGAGRLYQIFGRNTGASDRFLFIYDAAAQPADGATGHLFVPVKVAAGQAFSIDLPRSRAFTAGLLWAASSTDASLTYDAAATFQVSAEYE